MKTIQKGFTLIELLIVIAVLGVLAVAVLSAINPIEQINRGRDTGARSDAEQILSAIDRFFASQQRYPWNMTGLAANDATGGLVAVNNLAVAGGAAGDTVLTALTDTGGGTGELKSAFVTRITALAGDRRMFIYNQGTQGSSTYICFIPQSGSFTTESEDRCADPAPDDLPAAVWAQICGGGVGSGPNNLVCLP